MSNNLDYSYIEENAKPTGKLKVKSIKPVGKKPVYEITVDKAHSYLLENGVIKTNTGGVYSSDSILIIGKRQVKTGSELSGWDFVLNIEKSRSIREKSALPLRVLYNGGIMKYSGLLEIGLATGYVVKPKNGWYTRPTVEGDKNWRESESNCDEFWEPLLSDQAFKDKVSSMFKLTSSMPTFDDKMLDKIDLETATIDPETGEILES